MAQYQIEHVTFTFPEQTVPALSDISLTIAEGEFLLLCGATGSGKTTFLRQLKREVWPEGHRSGEIVYEGQPIAALSPVRAAAEIGMVFQHPDAQIVMGNVQQELAFALENLNLPPAVIQRRMAEMVSFLGMESWLRQSVHELSGGQKQLLNLASVLMMRPKVLLLDEPTAQLDPIAAKEFVQVLQRLNQELSLTIIIAEHRLEELFQLATTVCVFAQGTICDQGMPREVIERIASRGEEALLPLLPSVSRMALQAGAPGAGLPLTVREGKAWLAALADQQRAGTGDERTRGPELPGAAGKSISGDRVGREAERVREAANERQQQTQDSRDEQGGFGQEGSVRAGSRLGERAAAGIGADRAAVLLACRSIFFQYEKEGPFLLHGCSFEVQAGELLAVMGGNGAGKSTLLRLLTGLLKPQRGNVELASRPLAKWNLQERMEQLGYLAQNPLLYFNRDTVKELLDDRLERLGLSAQEQKRRLHELQGLLGLEPLLHAHPHDLSGGQQQKVALALVLLADPQVLLLDEPTKGLDPYQKHRLAELLERWRRGGRTIVMVSHDVEFAARYATRCALLFDGQMIGPEATGDFFRQNYFYTTAIQRAAGGRWPELITEEDVGRWRQGLGLGERSM